MPEVRKSAASVLVVCALRAEAKPLAQAMELRGTRLPGCLHAWSDRAQSLWLVAGGVGRVSAAATTAAALAFLGREFPGAWRAVNAGLAGADDPRVELGTAWQAISVQEVATGRSFFPDLCWRQDACGRAGVVTGDAPQPPGEEGVPGPQPQLYDMEAAGFWQACQLQLPSDAIQAVKVVSDHGVTAGATPDLKAMRGLWEQGLGAASAFIRAFQQVPEPPRTELPEPAREGLEALTARWKLTWSQQQGLERALLRSMLRGQEPEKALVRSLEMPPPQHARERAKRWKGLCHELVES